MKNRREVLTFAAAVALLLAAFGLTARPSPAQTVYDSSLTLGSLSVAQSESVYVTATDATSPVTLTVTGPFTNAGVIALDGGGVAGATATLNVASAAPSTLYGEYELFGSTGRAVVQFGSGGVVQIGGAGSQYASGIFFDRNNSYFEVAGGAPNTNSALNKLATIAGNGNLWLNDGNTVNIAGGLSNAGQVGVDHGSLLTVGGNYTSTGYTLMDDQGALVVSGDLTNIGSGGTYSPQFCSGAGCINVDTQGSLTVDGRLTNSGGIDIATFGSGGASLTVNGAGGYTQTGGSTTVNGGDLDVVGNVSNDASSSISIQNGGAALLGPVDNFGQIATGNASHDTGNNILSMATVTNETGGQLSLDAVGDNATVRSFTNSGTVSLASGTSLTVGQTEVQIAANGTTQTFYVQGAPTEAERLGDFSGLRVIVDAPGTATPASNNTIPASELSDITFTPLGGSVNNAGSVAVGIGSTLNASGAYTQSAGTTGVNGTLIAAGGVYVNGGTLSGNGTVNGSVVNGATVYPGDPVTLTINGNYTQTANGVLVIDVSSATDFTTLKVTGNATLGGSVDFDFLNGYVPGANTDFAFLDVMGSVSGNFTGFDFSGIDCPSCTFNVSSLSLDTGSTAPTRTTPEPASLLLLGTGLMGLALAVRARRVHAT